MCSGKVVSADELIRRINEKASNDRAEKAFSNLEDIYAQRGSPRSKYDNKTDLESLKAIDDICTRTLKGRFVLPLPAGGGKTTLIVAWCTFIHESKTNYSVAVASLQVDACFKLRQQLLDQGIPEEDIGILYSDKDKKMATFKSTS